jgi:hypothetical protein
MAGRFKLRVHEPCSEPWGSMAGDDRRRFCGRCSLHVHDLSAMREEAVMKLIAGPDPHLCIRYSVRDDGTAVIGESRARRWLRVAGLTALGAFFWATVVLVQLPWLALTRKLSPAPAPPQAQKNAEMRAREELERRRRAIRSETRYHDTMGTMLFEDREPIREHQKHRKHAKRK